MFNRVELKNNAKKILSKNYWWIVLVTLIFGLVSGGGTGLNLNLNLSGDTSIFSSFNNGDLEMGNEYVDDFGNSIDIDNGDLFQFGRNYRDVYYGMQKMFNGISTTAVAVFLWIFMIVAAITLVLKVFVLNPLQVGCRRWYLHNRKEKPEMSEIVHEFSRGYVNTVKVMFCRDLFTFLWTLLFIIPGIIKGYEYRMIPFLLAENPEMEMNEAFERSRNLMNGNKWDTFVLDLSFIGWEILVGFTCGILAVFYVRPYEELTNTELYVCLCQGQGRYTTENGGNRNPYGDPYNHGDNGYDNGNSMN